VPWAEGFTLIILNQARRSPIAKRSIPRVVGYFERPPSKNHFAYNFTKIHRTLRVSPAMAAGVTNRLWNVEAEGGKSGVNEIAVEVDQKWVSLVRSPLYHVVTSLTGVSVTFAPLFLYLSGKGAFYHG
jgi:hypothetical protein